MDPIDINLALSPGVEQQVVHFQVTVCFREKGQGTLPSTTCKVTIKVSQACLSDLNGMYLEEDKACKEIDILLIKI